MRSHKKIGLSHEMGLIDTPSFQMKEKKQICIVLIDTIVDDQHLVKRYQKQKVTLCSKLTLP